MKKILHIDMDAFYASVEQRDNPEYKGKPLAVGGGGNRGVVAAASYEARKYGVFSAMPGKMARSKCPGLIFVKPDFEKYKQVSRQIRQIFQLYTDLVEPLSLDEAYLDVTTDKQDINSATVIARMIKNRIFSETGLTASAGVSFNKFLAKVASGWQKPDGITVIEPNQAEAFIAKLPIGDFYGIGSVTAERFRKMGIYTGRELRELPQWRLVKLFGKAGIYYYEIAHGIDNREVQPDRERKSIGAENTFEEDFSDGEKLEKFLDEIAGTVASRAEKLNAAGKTVTLKIKYTDFVQRTRSRTLADFISQKDVIFSISRELLYSGEGIEKPIRLLGITLSNLQFSGKEKERQLKLDIFKRPEHD